MKNSVKVDGLMFGRKARAIASESHAFENGEPITFVGDGIIDEEKGFYSYVFTNNDIVQMLESYEFELID